VRDVERLEGPMLTWRFVKSAALVLPVALIAVSMPRATTLPTLSTLQTSLRQSWTEALLPPAPDPAIGDMGFGLASNELRGQTNCGAIGWDQTDITSETPCFFGDLTAKRSIVVVGDSQAGQWMPTMDSWGKQHGWKVYRVVKNGCAPWQDMPGAWTNCQVFQKWEVQTILSLRPEVVIGAGMEKSGQANAVTLPVAMLTKAFEDFAAAFTPIHAKVLIMQNTPWFFAVGDPDACLSANPSSIKRCNHDARSVVVNQQMSSALGAAVRTKTISVVPVDELLCTASTCPVVVGKFNLYGDMWHFHEAWGRHIVKAFDQLIEPALHK
jgi:hypothetical protein